MSHDKTSEQAFERSGSLQSNPNLYAEVYSGFNDKSARLNEARTGATGTAGDGQYLEFSNPYAGTNGGDSQYGSRKFAEEHPWRQTVLDGANALEKEVRKDGGHLDGQYDPLMKQINSVRAEEERDAAANGTHLTENEKAHLLSEESKIEKEIRHDHREAAHHGRHGHGHGHGHRHLNPTDPTDLTNPGEPVGSNPSSSGPVDSNPSGSNPTEANPPDSNPTDSNPSGTTPGDPSLPPSDSKFLLGTAVIPGDVGASNANAAINDFSRKVGVQQQEQMFYTNQNVAGRSSVDVADMIKDAQQGITPVLSLRTLPYKDVINGSDDQYLKQVAGDLKQVQAAGKAAGFSGDVILRPNWEMDGSARQTYGTPAEFVASWQHMHDVISSQGANPKWAFTPNAPSYDAKVPNWSSPASEYYPGDKYVDYIGSDGYSGLFGASYQSPDKIFSAGVSFAEQHGKQFYIGETGVANRGTDPTTGKPYNVEFMQEMASYIKANPDIAGMSWFSEGSNNVLSNPAEQAAFTTMEKQLGGQPV